MQGINNATHAYTLDMCKAEIEELMSGDKEAAFDQALWNACTSAGFSLELNSKMAIALRPYVEDKLPVDTEEIAHLLIDACGNRAAGRSQYTRAIYRARELRDAGLLDQFANFPDDLAGQREWRQALWDLYHTAEGSYGMSYKTLSMAALILFPDRSHLVPVDKHVLARFDIRNTKGELKTDSPQDRKPYERIEDMVLAEIPEIIEAIVQQATELLDLNEEQASKLRGILQENLNGLAAHWITWMWRREEQAEKRPDGKVAGDNHLALNCHMH